MVFGQNFGILVMVRLLTALWPFLPVFLAFFLPDKETVNITCCSPVFAIMATPLKINSQPNQIKSKPNQVPICPILIHSLVLCI